MSFDPFALQSSILKSVPGVIHGFGTLDEPIPLAFGSDWSSRRPRWRQTHGISLARVQTPAQECGEVDALFSDQEDLAIGVVTADCVPILMAHQSGSVIAAIHAGWRGTRAHILKRVWDHLIEGGEKPQEWVAAIGPAIGPCCYEVSEELFRDFAREFAEESLAETFALHQKDRKLDLAAVNAWELRRLGLKQVDVLRICTFCSERPRFNSFRRDRTSARQYSIIKRA